MEGLRKPFQGVWNIIRFNWQYYILSLVFVVVLLIFNIYLSGNSSIVYKVLALLVIGSILLSLAISYYIYDLSNLYELTWLDIMKSQEIKKIVNINAGFDETSHLLANRYKTSELIVLDFYDPLKHTEVSIKRARKAYPPYPNTQNVSTSHLPLENDSADKIFAILSAHEIRKRAERNLFFDELNRILKPSGRIILTEHLRDSVNFAAYNIGFFHFHSKATWKNTFQHSGLVIYKEIKITPFITTFILAKNGTES